MPRKPFFPMAKALPTGKRGEKQQTKESCNISWIAFKVQAYQNAV